MSFVYTTAIKKLRKLTKRVKVVPGGTSAGKTFGILPILIDLACKTPGIEISVVSATIPHLRKGAIKDFVKIMRLTNRFIDSHWNRTVFQYTFANGSFIEFFSADQEGKVRGPRRDVLYINECNNIDFETYHQLAIRTSKGIWLDFNPTHSFWVHDELKEDEDIEWLTLTYVDNEALPESIVKELEKAKDKAQNSEFWRNWWKVYGLGQTGSIEGVLFPSNDLRYFEPSDVLTKSFESSLSYADIADEGSDSTSAPIGRNIKQDIYITDVLFNAKNSDITIPLLAYKMKDQGVRYIRVESNSMGAMYARNLKKEVPTTCQVLTAVATQNKHTRILMDAGFIVKHCLFLKPEFQSDEYKSFMKQLTSYMQDGSSKHDDAPDSLQGLVLFVRGLLPNYYR